jgi:hypothetical protein
MIRLEDTIDSVVRKLKQMPDAFQRAALGVFKGAGDEIVRQLRVPGKARAGAKVHWDTPVQQRAYFATGGFGTGIPYRRTGRTVAAWRNEAIANGYLVSNVGRKAVFLYGTASGTGTGRHVTSTGQSHIHVGFWPLFRPLVDKVVARLPEKILVALRVIKIEDR